MTLQLEAVVERKRPQLPCERFGERLPFSAVQHGVVGEIRRRLGLIGGDQLDEGFLAQRLKRIVRLALLADRRHRFFGERLPAQRACAMRRIHETRVRQLEQLGVQRVVERLPRSVGRPSERRAQIGAADIADKQRVAGENRMRNRVAHRTIEDEDRDRLGRVSGRLEGGQSHPSKLDAVAVAEWFERILRRRRAPQVNRRARLFVQLEMTGDEVGMKVREDDVTDRQPTFGGKR